MVIPIHDLNPTRRRAWVTLLIIAINVVVYVAVQPHGDANDQYRFNVRHAAIPCEIKEREPAQILELNEQNCDLESEFSPQFAPDKNIWLSILFSMFLHGSLIHIAGNMLFLWIFGNNVEDYLSKIGFVLFYLLAGAAATFSHVLYNPSSLTPVIGASGAIAGVMGMYLVLWPRAKVVVLVPFLAFIPLPIPAAVVLVMWFGLQFLTGDDSGVAWVAHVGGFATGVLIGLAMKKFKTPFAVEEVD
ncbi:MAG: rhomboid family intramembrane serine protease [Acidimicrobiia bacterium]|nr:rhomboid family intramembrane serine protease [Acidimicrobiia bacterium]